MYPLLTLPCLIVICQVDPALTPREIYDQLISTHEQRVRDMTFSIKAHPEKAAETAFTQTDLDKKTLDLAYRLSRLANDGNVEAQYFEGIWNFNSAKNFSAEDATAKFFFKDAEKYLRLAATSSYAPAMCALAHMASSGRGLSQSNLVAIEWYAKAGDIFLKAGDRENALGCLDDIKKLDSSHPYAKVLFDKLYPPAKKSKQR